MIAKHLMVEIPATKVSTYPIIMQTGLLERPDDWLEKEAGFLVIITDSSVQALYANALEKRLKNAGHKTLVLAFQSGEASKTIGTKCQLEEQMLQQGSDRRTLILALGGGVVGDMAGFIAATFMRGIAYIQIPTTLLAMLDSSVGGKTGIDTPQGKNLIGAFWHPKAVVSDLACLKTLSKEHLINGLIEAIKIFLTSDAESFSWLQVHLEDILSIKEDIIANLVFKAVKIKAEVVKNDEKEVGLRMILNFGHTIGHALEQMSNFQLLHGYAVAYGILVEAKIAQLLGILNPEIYNLINALFMRLAISPDALKQFNLDELIKTTQFDKKNSAGQVNYVLLSDLGKVHQYANKYAHPVPNEIVLEAFSLVIRR